MNKLRQFFLEDYRHITLLVIALAVPFVAAKMGSMVTITTPDSWYAALNKPFFQPPGWVFAPVWTALYLMMGIAWYRVMMAHVASVRRYFATSLFLLQLSFNVLWSVAFFGLYYPALAFGVIVVLWVLIFATMHVFWRIERVSGMLLVPYLLWVTFASMINIAIVALN
jgi:benzodiazapine receptor